MIPAGAALRAEYGPVEHRLPERLDTLMARLGCVAPSVDRPRSNQSIQAALGLGHSLQRVDFHDLNGGLRNLQMRVPFE
jgi:hypothetical protein